jgi:hypothetical protein
MAAVNSTAHATANFRDTVGVPFAQNAKRTRTLLLVCEIATEPSGVRSVTKPTRQQQPHCSPVASARETQCGIYRNDRLLFVQSWHCL